MLTTVELAVRIARLQGRAEAFMEVARLTSDARWIAPAQDCLGEAQAILHDEAGDRQEF